MSLFLTSRRVRGGLTGLAVAAMVLTTAACGGTTRGEDEGSSGGNDAAGASADPDAEIPALAADVLSGALRLDHLITDRIGLADVPAAFDRMARGEGARSVVVF